MEEAVALVALSALAQETRLRVFRLLVTAGPHGMPAGQIAEELSVAPNTLSFHLNLLRNAGLIVVRREGRSLIYSAEYERIGGVLAYLSENCCSRRPCRG